MTREILSKAEALAGGFPPLLLKAQEIAVSFMRGAHGLRRAGAGEAFWQFRPYAAGDAMRDVDWKQTAKGDETFVRQREREISQTVWLYRDASASMDFSSRDGLPKKREYAEILLLAAAMTMLDGGERVGLLGTDLAPQTRYAAVQNIFEFLPQQTHLAQQGRPVAAGAQVVIISDFYFPPEELAAVCERLALQRVQGALVQVFDPAERDFPYDGRVRFVDSENTRADIIIPQIEAVRAAYRQKFSDHQENIAALAQSWGWSFDAVATDTNPEETLATLYRRLEKA